MKQPTLPTIQYIDSFAWGTAHEMFNASILWMCTQIPCSQVICRATKSNIHSMERLLESAHLDTHKVITRPIPTVGGRGRLPLLIRYLLGTIQLCWHLVFSVRTQDIVLLPFNNLFALKGINFLSKLLSRRVLIFCHGELEFVVSQVNKQGLLSRILSHRCLRFFTNPRTHISHSLFFSVLGNHIRHNLKNILPPSFSGHLFSMAHPYLFFKSSEHARHPHKKLSIGTCGTMTLSKGALVMAQFAAKCRDRHLDIDIYHVGSVLSGLDEMLQAGIHIPSAERALSREAYDEKVNQLDYLLFFYDPNSYQITASGAVMDAIALQKPIIALRNDYFQYLFDTFGPFGILDNSVDAMVEHISQICEGRLLISCDFRHIQEQLSPQSLLPEFEQILQAI